MSDLGFIREAWQGTVSKVSSGNAHPDRGRWMSPAGVSGLGAEVTSQPDGKCWGSKQVLGELEYDIYYEVESRCLIGFGGSRLYCSKMTPGFFGLSIWVDRGAICEDVAVSGEAGVWGRPS